MAAFNKVVGIVGWKNSGKTTLVIDLIQCFRQRGLIVSAVKHAYHAFDIDRPGKDSCLCSAKVDVQRSAHPILLSAKTGESN